MREVSVTARTRALVLDGDPDRVAVLLPGVAVTCDYPPLRYGAVSLQARGWTVAELAWDPLREEGWVEEQARAALDLLGASRGLLVGKSLGTRAAPVAAERGLPGIWLTPLLRDPRVVDALERAAAPALLVGGTADELWDGAVAARLPAEVLELEGADHGLEVGDALACVDLLRRVVERVDGFVARLDAG